MRPTRTSFGQILVIPGQHRSIVILPEGPGKRRYIRLPEFHPATTCWLPWRPTMATSIRHILDRYRVTSGKDFRLTDFDPSDTSGHLLAREQAEAMVVEDVER